MGRRKADTEGIDEVLLLESIKQRKRDGGVQPTNERPPPFRQQDDAPPVSEKTQEQSKAIPRRKKKNAD